MIVQPDVAIIGAGPAGLMAAETLGACGLSVVVFEKMPSVGRKFLMAGRGGLNLTHTEPESEFIGRYGPVGPRLSGMVQAFSPDALRAWADGLGQDTFVGPSGRVFPKAMKASPLLRSWLVRLTGLGVDIRPRHDWRGWDQAGALVFNTPDGDVSISPRATILALGGASWPRLGSDGAWTPHLKALGVEIAPFRPANSGFDVDWSEIFRDRFNGAPLKGVELHHKGASARGDIVVTRYGLEGGALYALSAGLRDAVERDGSAELVIDLRPDQTASNLIHKLVRAKSSQSLANHLRKAVSLSPAAVNLMREVHGVALPTASGDLARAIKNCKIRLSGVQPLARAISSAGGVAWNSLNDDLALKARPDVFVAGEMLDWEAPTGGYLLQGSFATGVAAAQGVLKALGR